MDDDELDLGADDTDPWRPVLDGMDLVVLPDTDERVAWLAAGDVACDGRAFFVRASDWPELRDLLLALAEPSTALSAQKTDANG